jgi:Phage tail assembly chaperone protein, TAC
LHKTPAGLFAEVIDGKTYEFEKWGALEAVDTLIDLSKITGKPLGMGIANIFSKDDKTQMDPNVMGAIMEALTGNLKKKLTRRLIMKFSSEKCFCEGKPINFDQHYRDNLFHLFKVVRAGLEVQYGNFIGAVLGSAGVSLPKPAIMNRAG